MLEITDQVYSIVTFGSGDLKASLPLYKMSKTLISMHLSKFTYPVSGFFLPRKDISFGDRPACITQSQFCSYSESLTLPLLQPKGFYLDWQTPRLG